MLELISLSLGLPKSRFNNFFKKDQTSFLRLNYYPRCPIPHLALGVGHHKDAGGLTVLAQDDVGGLEVKRKTDGEWIRVKPTPDAFIVNVGDIIQVNYLEVIPLQNITSSKLQRVQTTIMVSLTSSNLCGASLYHKNQTLHTHTHTQKNWVKAASGIIISAQESRSRIAIRIRLYRKKLGYLLLHF